MSNSVTAGAKRTLGVMQISIKECFLSPVAHVGEQMKTRSYPLGAYDRWLKLFPFVWLLTVSLTFAKLIET